MQYVFGSQELLKFYLSFPEAGSEATACTSADNYKSRDIEPLVDAGILVGNENSDTQAWLALSDWSNRFVRVGGFHIAAFMPPLLHKAA